MTSEAELWQFVLKKIEEKVTSDIAYRLWFEDLQLKHLVADKAYLQTPNLYKKKTLENQFTDLIKEVFLEVAGFPIIPRIIATETRPFEEQYYEILEADAKAQLEEEEKSGKYDSEPISDEPELIEPGVPHGRFKLGKKNLNFPKVYNPKNESLEEVSLLKYMDNQQKTGMMLISKTAPDYKPTYTFQNFVVGKSNQHAYATCYSVANYPAAQYNPLFIYGPPGIGKTHLLYAIANHIGNTRPAFNIVYSTSEDFTNELLHAITHKTTADFREKYRSADILMVDDIQFIGGKEATQLEFFHTFDTLYKANKQIIVVSDRPPKDIVVLEQRIRSRFESGAIIDIQSPDPELRGAIIRRKAIDMGILIPSEAADYIAKNVKDNVRQIEGILKSISAYSNLNKEPITLDLVKSIVGDVVSEPVEINSDLIISTVARYMGVTSEEILSKKKTNNIAMARHITAYLLRRLTDMTLQQVGAFIGRHYTTVLDSEKLIDETMKTNTTLSDQVNAIMAELSENK